MSQNEWKTTEIRASKVGNFSPFSCPGHARLSSHDRDDAKWLGFTLPPADADPPPRERKAGLLGLDAARRAFEAAARAHDEHPAPQPHPCFG